MFLDGPLAEDYLADHFIGGWGHFLFGLGYAELFEIYQDLHSLFFLLVFYILKAVLGQIVLFGKVE